MCTTVHVAWPRACERSLSLNVELIFKDVNYMQAQCLTPRVHVAALALQALKALCTHSPLSKVENLAPSIFMAN